MISLDKVAYTSKLLKNNPSEKLLFSILTLFSCIFFNNILVSLIVLFIMYSSNISNNWGSYNNYSQVKA